MPTLSDAQIAAALKQGGFPADQIGIGVAVALAESGGRTDALNTANRNGTWDAGLMQVNSIHGYSQQYLFNVQNNVAAALKIYKEAGNKWTPWATYNSGRYRIYLARGNAAAGKPAAALPNTGNPDDTINRNPVDSGDGIFDAIFSATTWKRIGLFLLGGILMLFGLYQMTGVGGLIIKTAKGVVSARTGGIL